MTEADALVEAGRTTPALALLRPFLDRLDGDRRALAGALEPALAYLHGMAIAGRPVADAPDAPLQRLIALEPRFEQPLALMRQAFAREAGAPKGVLFSRWSDLHNHLRFGCVPVGRALLAIHGEAAIAEPALAAFMISVGLTALLQDAPRRCRQRGQIVLPAQWFPAGAAIETCLASRARMPALSTAYANAACRLDEALNMAESGMRAVHNEGLRRGMAAGVYLMRRLRLRMMQRTPNVRPVSVTALDRLLMRWRT